MAAPFREKFDVSQTPLAAQNALYLQPGVHVQAYDAALDALSGIPTPLVIGDRLFVSAEYGPGAGFMRVEGSTLVDVWGGLDSLTTHYATPVQANGILYGYHGRQEFGPSLRAVELSTGKVHLITPAGKSHIELAA